jgi:hypothetical protein
MELPLTGGCQCGKIRYEVTENSATSLHMPLHRFQRITGSAFSLGIALPETAFRRTAGEPRARACPTVDGSTRASEQCIHLAKDVIMVDADDGEADRHVDRAFVQISLIPILSAILCCSGRRNNTLEPERWCRN